MRGNVSGNTATGTLTRTNGTYTDLIWFTADIDGDTMTIHPTSIPTNYSPEIRACAGEWKATRQ